MPLMRTVTRPILLLAFVFQPRPADVETNPRFTHDGKRVSFTRGGNLYVMPLDSGMLAQLTDIRAAAAPGAAPAAAAGGRGGLGAGRGQGGGRGAAPVVATGDTP